jgi:hypothetical protein
LHALLWTTRRNSLSSREAFHPDSTDTRRPSASTKAETSIASARECALRRAVPATLRHE